MEQLNAIRDIMSPPSTVIEATPSLDQWNDESMAVWRSKIGPLPEGDGRRHERGFWTVAFKIESFDNPTLVQLNTALDREMPAYSGWRPFTYLHRIPSRPVASGNVIEAWLARSHDQGLIADVDEHADFWRISRDGFGFLLRPMQEDRPEYRSNISPRGEGPFFDWTLPIYRLTEILKFIEAIGFKFSNENAEFHLLLRYHGMSNRILSQNSFRYNLFDGASCSSDVLETRLRGSISEIGLALEEKIFTLLTPIYEQFEFTELPKALVDNVVRNALSFRR